MPNKEPIRYSLDTILAAVCDATGIEEKHIIGKERLAEECEARFIYSTLAVKNRHTVESIGARINRHYSTVIWGRKKCYNLYETDKYFRACYQRAEAILEEWEKGIKTVEKEILYDPITGEFGKGIKAQITIKYNYGNN